MPINSDYFKVKAGAFGDRCIDSLLHPIHTGKDEGLDEAFAIVWAETAAHYAGQYLSWKRRESRKCQSKRGPFLRCELKTYHDGQHVCNSYRWNRGAKLESRLDYSQDGN